MGLKTNKKITKTSSNQLRLGAALSYASMAIGYIIQLGYTPVMIRIIGQNQYGIYNLTNSIVNYLSLFSLGFAPAYVRFYMRHKIKDGEKAIARMNGMFMAVFLFLGAIATVCGFLMVQHTREILGSKFNTSELDLAKKLMFMMVVNIAISFPLIPIVSFIQANERFVFQNTLNIIKQILNPFLALPLLLMGYGSLGMIATTTIITFLISSWQLIYSFRVLNFSLSFHQLDFRELREVGVFSSFIFLNAMTDQINWNVDKFIIGRYYGAISVAVYGVAAQLNSYYLNFSTAISNVYIPKVNRIVAESDDCSSRKKLTELFIKIGRAQFVIVGLILSELVVVGREFIYFWAGKDYVQAYPILIVLIIPVTVPLIQNVGISIQQAMNKHVFRSIVYFLIAVANIGLSLILVKPFGGLGTAVATAISLILGNGIIMNWYYRRHIHLNIAEFWLQMSKNIPAIALSILAGFFLKATVNAYQIKGFVLSSLLVLMIYLLLVWVFVLDREEKNKSIRRIALLLK